MMNFFSVFKSNTMGAGANQNFFEMKEGEIRTGIAFYKITAEGKYNYSLLFSDKTDSTFAKGDRSRANLVLGGFTIHSLRVGRCKSTPIGEEAVMAWEPSTEQIEDLTPLTFGGELSHTLAPAELCHTDPKSLYFDKNEYIAVELTYSGRRVPCHTENMLPVYNKTESGYKYCVDMPQPLMIGCDREVKGVIGYFGDSITQGIGAGFNNYLHWTARIADKIGDEYSHYNLGIGYARARDAASDGDWLSRAKSCDTVFLCLGLNDDEDARTIANNLKTTICKLKESNCRIILQTAPPFDREGERGEVWFELNNIIKNELKDEVELVFDNAPYLSLSSKEPHKSKYGGHPNAEGCGVWAEALYPEIKHLF